MSAYRFCRTDDIGLLVDALNRCWAPHVPEDPPATPESFKRSIRDLQVWCSSCMVAFAGSDPIGVLIGAKRPTATLVHRIAVHPDHRRQGHARHMLASLGSKLAILGPPRIVAEVPDSCAPARGLFLACGYTEDAVLTDFVSSHRTPSADVQEEGRFLIPVTMGDLAANGLLDEAPPSERLVCWQRTVQALTARKDEIQGLALASVERIEAYVLSTASGELLSLRSLADDGDAGLERLLLQLRERPTPPLRLNKVHPAEISTDRLAALGFSAVGTHRRFVTTARG
jgi:GNAT superfamily N-acetyltransferase